MVQLPSTANGESAKKKTRHGGGSNYFEENSGDARRIRGQCDALMTPCHPLREHSYTHTARPLLDVEEITIIIKIVYIELSGARHETFIDPAPQLRPRRPRSRLCCPGRTCLCGRRHRQMRGGRRQGDPDRWRLQ